MELNINSPAYFTNYYGVDDEVYSYCQNLHNFFKTKEYSETLTIIGITPIVAPKEIYNQGLWKEKVQIISLGTCAIIDIRMDFESYYNADSKEKIELIKQIRIVRENTDESRKNYCDYRLTGDRKNNNCVNCRKGIRYG